MAIQSAQVAVDDAPAVALVSASGSRGQRVYLRLESGDDPVFLGPSTVTALTGAELVAGDNWVPFEIYEGDTLYGICGTAGTATVHVLIT